MYYSIVKPVASDSDLQDRSAAFQYLFENVDLTPDISNGQRGFNRNIDRLCNQLIQFYRQKYPQDAEVTLNDIAKREEEERLRIKEERRTEEENAQAKRYLEA